MLNRSMSRILVGALAFVLVLPIGASGAMSSPDAGVSAAWRAGTLAQAQSNNGNGANNANNGNGNGTGAQATTTTSTIQNIQNFLNTIQISGSFESGTVEFKGTVTDVNASAKTLAVNGIWVNPQRWIDLARAANFRLTGADPNTMMTALANLAVGDRIQVRAEIANGNISIVQWSVKKANPNQIQIQARLQDLLRQVSDLLDQLRNR